MLVELAVRDLGVIESARIAFAPGATALTGETGAGKTMVVEALQLICGARADPQRVRTGADEAVVEALFHLPGGGGGGGDGDELVVRRVVPADGRSRAYLDGELVPLGRLVEVTAPLVEIHGQHSQQGLLRPSAQRSALDRFAGVDTTELDEARRTVRDVASRLEALGGDAGLREREVVLLRHQVAEIDEIAPSEDEDERLELEEDLLDGALEHRAAGDLAVAALADDDGVVDLLARVVASLAGRAPYAELSARLASLSVDLGEVGSDLRRLAEGIEVDDERLAAVRARRQLLADLRRKYGGSVTDVVEFARRARERLEELETVEARAAELEQALAGARSELATTAAAVGAARRSAAPELATAVAAILRELALPACTVEVAVSDEPELPGAAGHVEVLLAANPGSPPAPLSRVASGGELSRVMLALRLVGSGGPATMVFDEVDAGIGGEAANAVAGALRGVAAGHQVLVVTHLAQIAAVADAQVVVEKSTDGRLTRTRLRPLDRDGRIVELSRMLSGSPDSAAARRHAEELLHACEAATGTTPGRQGTGA